MKRNSCIIYESYLDAIRQFPEKVQGRLALAILAYAFYGEEPELKGPEKALFIAIRPQIDNANQRYDSTVEQKKGPGAPRGNKNACKASAESGELRAESVERNEGVWLEQFKADDSADMQRLCEGLGVTKPVIQTMADQIFSEWSLTQTTHKDFADFARHMVSTLKIKAAANRTGTQPTKAVQNAIQTIGNDRRRQETNERREQQRLAEMQAEEHRQWLKANGITHHQWLELIKQGHTVDEVRQMVETKNNVEF